ncbi:hypothetical protein F3Y22_tig00110206pilonHSYRG00342 [Hibiscus syriacus]|uniref:dihydrolipoyllysine-residue succinyltransferase n=1 Tax=Hibiscus syriacus TaxID=106335 RepID=A0A6A3BCC7_HIBSY|nr:hypothetical protein F3Y22_tig00110206pilonHSYRG00342 [Hibiscus syriacus]
MFTVFGIVDSLSRFTVSVDDLCSLFGFRDERDRGGLLPSTSGWFSPGDLGRTLLAVWHDWPFGMTGLVHDAEKMNFAEIEKTINNLAKKATDGTISIDEMAGGSFTISNGGVYGSLLSTPIINPPQVELFNLKLILTSAILGMHSIVSRPMAVGGNVVPRPMMYIALTYDHRLIDGREAAFFFRRINDVVEDPRRLLLDV